MRISDWSSDVCSSDLARDDTARKESVGAYLNEVPISVALFNPDLDTFDLARVEVLRGPQGTLYGAGSLAGTVRLITNQPSSTKFEAKGDATLRSEEHTSELQSLMRISYAVFCLQKKKHTKQHNQ